MGPGARSKFDTPMFVTEIFQKQTYCIDESTCDIVWTFWRPRSALAPPWWRAVASGRGAVVPGSPIWNRCPPISRLAHRLLHTSNTAFQKCAPLLVFGPSFWFFSPLLLNPGDGPAMVTRRPRNCAPLVTHPNADLYEIGLFSHKFIYYAWWQPRKERQQWK